MQSRDAAGRRLIVCDKREPGFLREVCFCLDYTEHGEDLTSGRLAVRPPLVMGSSCGTGQPLSRGGSNWSRTSW